MLPDWFERNEMTIVDFAAADNFAILRVKDKEENENFYSLMNRNYWNEIYQNCGEKSEMIS